MKFLKSTWAKVLGFAQFAGVAIEQASSGHFPQNKAEWMHLLTSALLWAALHHAASTDGTK